MLGLKVSRTTVAKYMVRRPRPRSPTWRAFIQNHAGDLIGSRAYADFARRLHAAYVSVRHALHRWLSSGTTRGEQQSTRRHAVPCTLPSDTAPVPSLHNPSSRATGEEPDPDAGLML
jgi:hypothetical protein